MVGKKAKENIKDAEEEKNNQTLCFFGSLSLSLSLFSLHPNPSDSLSLSLFSFSNQPVSLKTAMILWFLLSKSLLSLFFVFLL